MSGCAEKGEITAIMGLSGSGKTTLLKTLAGEVSSTAQTQGVVLFDQKQRNYDWLERIGYVNQDDIYYENLTVRQTLRYAYLFRKLYKNKSHGSEKNISFGEKFSTIFQDKISEEKIDEIIHDLKIQDCCDTEMSRVSGGELKRVMIGVEMMADPEVLFLDEPTSGLDTYTALKLIKVLKGMADKHGKTIILTIHQPTNEIFNLINKVILLQKGNLLYSGAPSKVLEFFSKYGFQKRETITVSEFMIEICSEEFQKDNPYLFESNLNVFADNVPDFSKKKLRSSNQSHIRYYFNFLHILKLYTRKFRLDTTSLFDFFKISIFRLLPHILSFMFLFLIKKIFMKDIDQCGSNDAVNYVINTINGGFIFFYYIALFPLIMVQTSNSCNSSYIDDLRIIRKEISVDYFSVTSIYLSRFLYVFTTEMISCFVTVGLSACFFRDLLSFYLISIYCVSNLTSIVFSQVFSSITGSKMLNRIIGFIIIFLIISNCGFFATTQIYSEFLVDQKNSSLTKVKRIVSYLLATLPISHGYALCFHFTKKYLTGLEIVRDCEEALKQQGIDLHVSPSYFGGAKLTIIHIFLFYLATCFLFAFLGIYLLGSLTKPNIRYILEKKNK